MFLPVSLLVICILTSNSQLSCLLLRVKPLNSDFQYLGKDVTLGKEYVDKDYMKFSTIFIIQSMGSWACKGS